MQGRIFRNLIGLVFSEAFVRITNLALMVYFARVLDVAQFGILSVVQTVVTVATIPADIGVARLGIGEIVRSRDKQSEVIEQLLGLRITASMITFLTVIAAVWLSNASRGDRLVYLLGDAFILVTASSLDWVIKGLERNGLLLFSNLTNIIGSLCLAFAFVTHKDDAMWAAGAGTCGAACACITNWLLARRIIGYFPRPQFSIPSLIRWLRSAAPFAISTALMALIQYVPIPLLAATFDNSAAARLSAAYRPILPLAALGAFISTAYYPMLAEFAKTNKRQFLFLCRKIELTTFILGGVITTIFFLGASSFINILYGGKYNSSAVFFRILSPLVLLELLRYAYIVELASLGRQRQETVAMIWGALTMAITGIVMMSLVGENGMGLAILMSEAVALVTMKWFLWKSKLDLMGGRTQDLQQA